MVETALPIVREIITNLGGTSDAKTLVPALNDLKDLLGEGGISEAVDAWLDAHPEATTTVEDDSITPAKLSDTTFVTAEELAQILV